MLFFGYEATLIEAADPTQAIREERTNAWTRTTIIHSLSNKVHQEIYNALRLPGTIQAAHCCSSRNASMAEAVSVCTLRAHRTSSSEGGDGLGASGSCGSPWAVRLAEKICAAKANNLVSTNLVRCCYPVVSILWSDSRIQQS